MTLPRLVRDAICLLEGKVLPEAEAEALARLVGSSQELLAHLLVRRHALKPFPEIAAALERAAREAPGAASERPERGDRGSPRRDDYMALDAALRTLFDEGKASPAQANAAAALEQFRRGG